MYGWSKYYSVGCLLVVCNHGIYSVLSSSPQPLLLSHSNWNNYPILSFFYIKMVTSQAIEALKQALPSDQFIQRGTKQFDELNSSYLSGLESDLQPAYIFQPRSKEEVATFVKTFAPFINEDKFAIRGAGCQPLPGCANIQDGVTVDLGLLSGVDIQEGLVQVGAGEHWGTVYESLDSKGLGVCGSRSSKGGIGGLSLEGLYYA